MKHLRGRGTYCRTLSTSPVLIVILSGGLAELKVKMRVDVGSGSCDLGFLIMRLHAITPWSDKPSVISSSEYPLSKEQVITP